MRNAFRFLKDAELMREDDLIAALQRNFGRGDPLLDLFRRSMLLQKFSQKVDDWEMESVNLDEAMDGEQDPSEHMFEKVTLKDEGPEGRGRLRLRHGRLTAERDGKLRSLLSINLVPSSPCPSVISEWTRDMDSSLIQNYMKNNGDLQKTVDEFSVKFHVANITPSAVNDRLNDLILFARRIDNYL